MNSIDYLVDLKIKDDTREEAHQMEILKSKAQKVHKTIEAHNKPIRQTGLFDFMRDTWSEMLNTNQGARRYF